MAVKSRSRSSPRKLEGVQERLDLLTVPFADGHVLRAEVEGDVGVELVELLVAEHVAEVFADALAGLALDLVDAGDELVEVAVLEEPFGGGLRADSRHARQVVAGLADQGGQLPVVLGWHAVFEGDGLRGPSGPARTRPSPGRAR